MYIYINMYIYIHTYIYVCILYRYIHKFLSIYMKLRESTPR